MGIREPCQVGNEAALSGISHVTWGNRGLEEGPVFLRFLSVFENITKFPEIPLFFCKKYTQTS